MERVQCVLLALVLLCVSYSIDGFPDFIENINGLKIARDSNVCRYPKTRIVNVTTPVRRQITRMFMKTCYRKLKIPWTSTYITYTCLANTEINVTNNETRTRTSHGYSLKCCLHWKKTRPSDTDCKTPICPNGCRPHGKCIAGDTCKCDIGWQGYTCGQDINECYVQNGGCQQECSNTLGSYRCVCRKGYKTQPSDPTKCIDINECTSNKSKCFCFGNDQHCRSNIKCLNTIGAFKCKCPKGYRLINPTTCIDVDECLSWNSCQQKCTNQPGSFQCSCFKGLKYVKKTNKCEDINECSNNDGGCQQKCLNVYSSYLCRCNFGYSLARDRKNCIKYNIPGLDD